MLITSDWRFSHGPPSRTPQKLGPEPIPPALFFCAPARHPAASAQACHHLRRVKDPRAALLPIRDNFCEGAPYECAVDSPCHSSLRLALDRAAVSRGPSCLTCLKTCLLMCLSIPLREKEKRMT